MSTDTRKTRARDTSSHPHNLTAADSLHALDAVFKAAALADRLKRLQLHALPFVLQRTKAMVLSSLRDESSERV